jgi:segregation and condensation protein B
MDKEKAKGIVEAILFATGRIVKKSELMSILELSDKEIELTINGLKEKYEGADSGITIVEVKDGYQMATKKDYYEYLYPAFDNRLKPKLSQASLETLAIIAYNERCTRADIDTIRGVDTSGSVYKLLDYNLIEPAGKADLPGKPMTFKVTDEFMKMFGLKTLKDLPDLPKFKLDSNRQIVFDDLEAPSPAKGEQENLEENEENNNEDN